jgi:hypothetical protein
VIKPLVDKATELLSKFPIPGFLLGASFQPVQYDSPNRRLLNQELILSVQAGGMQIPNFHNFLNEARLSAIGLVVYLAGLLISVPTTSAQPKLLVLDDVLVGLDMANRLPVLDILESHFADWQIILLTYDRVWYEMVWMLVLILLKRRFRLSEFLFHFSISCSLGFGRARSVTSLNSNVATRVSA